MPRKLFRCSADSAPRVSAVGLLAEEVFFTCVVTGARVSAGVVGITGQRSEDAVSGVLEYEASSWLSLYAIPAVLHVTDSTSKGSFSSSGLGDLPVVAALSRTFLTPWSPTLGVAVVA